LTAVYSGDANFMTSTSAPVSLTVNAAIAVSLVSSHNSSGYGQAVTFTATVPSRATGSIQFRSLVNLGSPVTIVGTTAAITLSTLPEGSHPITAAYSGDSTHAAATSDVLTQLVTSAVLTVTANNSTRTFNQPNGTLGYTITGFIASDTEASSVTGTPTLSTTATAASPVGSYPIVIGQGTLASSSYSFVFVNGSLTVNKATLLVAANHVQRVYGQPNPTLTTTITGFVGGDTQAVVTGAPSVTTTATSTSPAGVYPIVVTQGTLAAVNYIFAFLNGNLDITPADPGVGPTPPVSIDASLNPAPAGSPVSFTFTAPAGATGTVSFFNGTALLGTVTIIGNTASLTTSALSLGTHTITTVYSGDANFMTATVTLSEVVISAADFTVASSTGRLSIPSGASANFTIVASSMNGPFTNSVTMSASNLPPGATYTFSPAAVTPGATGTNTTFTVSVPKQSSMASRGRRLGPVAFALLLLPFAWLKRYRRRPQRLLVWMLGLASLGVVSGCGGSSQSSQSQQTYTITVTGTSGNLVHNTTVTLTVE
jgi:hypothetical protein